MQESGGFFRNVSAGFTELHQYRLWKFEIKVRWDSKNWMNLGAFQNKIFIINMLEYGE